LENGNIDDAFKLAYVLDAVRLVLFEDYNVCNQNLWQLSKSANVEKDIGHLTTQQASCRAAALLTFFGLRKVNAKHHERLNNTIYHKVNVYD